MGEQFTRATPDNCGQKAGFTTTARRTPRTQRGNARTQEVEEEVNREGKENKEGREKLRCSYFAILA